MAAVDLAELLDLAERAAHAAGTLIKSRTDSDSMAAGADVEVMHTKSSPTDVVTAMDTASERLLRTTLLGARPDDGFLGEEGSDDVGTSGVRWVVDPIDGTVNYLYDIPQYAVSIAAELDGEVVVGVVHNPVSGETFTALRGGGAWLNGDAIRISAQTELSLALVGTGFGYSAERRARQAEVAAALLPLVRDIRRFGSAALDLCFLACGRYDAYYEQGLNPWDLAAGGLVASEAGAQLGGAHGAPAGSPLVIAASPALFDALHELVAELATSA